MIKFLVGVVTLLAVAALAVFVIYPFVFNGVSALFDNNDLGVVVALLACLVVTAPLLWIVVLAVGAAVITTGVVEDQRRFNRNRKRIGRI